MKTFLRILVGATALFLSQPSTCIGQGTVRGKVWGTTKDGTTVRIFTLRNQRGMEVKVAEYGALLVSIECRDRARQTANVTLSYESLEEAEKGGVFGSVIGRYANRIGGGGFLLDGERFDLESVNEKTKIHIHGGKTGFHRQVWKSKTGRSGDGPFVKFTLHVKDGHEGYPGNLGTSITYTLTNRNILRLHYEAVADKPTHVNLTNHVYFNLAGDGDIRQHNLQMKNIDKYVEVDDNKLPTGKLIETKGTVFDFSEKKLIGVDLEKVEGGGYDHCLAVTRPEDMDRLQLQPIARLSDPKSGRTLKIATTKPGVQIYTANHLKDNPFPKWGGICFETQYFPDTPNQKEFPSSLLMPDEKYEHITDFEFGLLED